MKGLGSFLQWFPPHTLGNPGTTVIAQTNLANIFTLAQKISRATAGSLMALETQDAGVLGAGYEGYHNSATPAANDTVVWLYGFGNDSGANKTFYGGFDVIISDPTNASEDGVSRMLAVIAGTTVAPLSAGDGVLLQGATGGFPGAGKVNATGYEVNGLELSNLNVQVITFQTHTADSTASNIPSDATKPRWDEGAEFWSQAVTPKSATSKIIIEIVATIGSSTTGNQLKVALFKNATLATDVAVAVVSQEAASNGTNNITLKWEEVSGSTAARTYAARFGAEAGTCHLNNNSASETMGGIYVTHVEVREVLQ